MLPRAATDRRACGCGGRRAASHARRTLPLPAGSVHAARRGCRRPAAVLSSAPNAHRSSLPSTRLAHRRWPRPASPRGRWARRRATRPAAILPCVRSCARSRAAGAKSARLWRVRSHDVCFAWRSQSAHGRSSLYGESASVLRVCGCDLKVRVVELFCATHIFRFYTTQACRACAQKSSGMVFHARRVAAML